MDFFLFVAGGVYTLIIFAIGHGVGKDAAKKEET